MTTQASCKTSVLLRLVMSLALPGVLTAMLLGITTTQAKADFRAGAAAVDITPTEFPVYVNGGFLARKATQVKSKLYARAITLDDGKTKIAIVVVDSCMMPRWLMDQAKAAASKSTGIPIQNMLISATHTHTAPSSFGCLGTPSDPAYEKFVIPRIALAIETAYKQLEPAQVGSAVADANQYTAVRRWIRRPDKKLVDPFGDRTVRANMHPGARSPDATGPSGPEDPDLSIVSIQSRDARPIAMLANFANHYVGASMLSADYFGLFALGIEKQLASQNKGDNKGQDDSQSNRKKHPPFVAMMSQGTSGDVWLWDYFKAEKRKRPDIAKYTDGMVTLALNATNNIKYKTDISLAMAQIELSLRYRTPDAHRLEWAKRTIEAMGDRLPKNKQEVYANEALILHKKQSTKIILQALRIGDIGLTAMPNEVYALTGLKLKAMSPLQPTINIELANGAEGYIPPPEQHALGGYNTWPARSAGLETQAEPKIVEALTQLLEQVAQKPRRAIAPSNTAASLAILESKPAAFWQLNQWQAPHAVDRIGKHHGVYESGIAFYLEGPRLDASTRPDRINRCPHFAGGRMRANIEKLGSVYTVEMWFFNGLVTDARPVTGYLFSRGRDNAHNAPGDHLGIGGTQSKNIEGKLFFFNGNSKNQLLVGKTKIQRWTWNHVALVRDADTVRVYLNGNTEPEIQGKAVVTVNAEVGQVFIGGRNDNFANFEGRIDEAAIYRRALGPKELAGHQKKTP